ncbi:uncharacterized protein BX663DRAFT_561767 [Cokeromyces recurvatus]|uniref:uncharacterized protein n=1 Tax=Cokeromyces recurvatus TaxID=90255 RepID=UPI00221E9A07|nr:uncharacterized protein BX663DRAFT_561767 [Cokeromyces recurvatus]KAI7902193.1 hypothetical protein BX663DRAFT_561767 [Cokeromyces recurvatus]
MNYSSGCYYPIYGRNNMIRRNNKPPSALFESMEKLIHTCHHLAYTLETTLVATHSGINAILQLTNRCHSLAHIFGLFSFLRWIKQRLLSLQNGGKVHRTSLFSIQEFQKYQHNTSSTTKVSFVLFIVLTLAPFALHLISTYQQKMEKKEERKKKIRGKSVKIDPKKLDFARALYPFRAESQNELSLQPNDLIAILSKEDPHWWRGRLKNGRMGYFPANHVEIIVKHATVPSSTINRKEIVVAPSA